MSSKINIIASDSVNHDVKVTVITEKDNDITIHQVYNDPINHIGTNIMPFYTFPSRIVMHGNFPIDYSNEHFSFLVSIIQDRCGETFLTRAIKNNDMSRVKLLIQVGAEVNVKTAYGETPLSIAIENNNVEMVKLLVQGEGNGKAYVNAKNPYGGPLVQTIKMNNEDIIKLLIQGGANVNSQDDEGLTPLLYAIACGKIEIVRLFLDRGANLNAKNKCGITPLMVAVKMSSEEIVRLLIEKGAIIDIKDYKGETPVFDAIRRNNIELVRLLTDGEGNDNKIDINDANKWGKTPLILTVEMGYLGIAELLIGKGAEIAIKNDFGETPIFDAIRRKNIMLVRLLANGKGNNKIDINAANKKGITPLMLALSGEEGDGGLEIAELLVNHNNNIDKDLLFDFIKKDNVLINARLVQLLVKKRKIQIKHENNEGLTPLLAAIKRGKKEIVKFLLERCQVPINGKNSAGLTPLVMSIEMRDQAINTFLTKCGGMPQGKDSLRFTAIQAESLEFIEFLIAKHKADVSIKNDKGETPIFDAIRKGDIELIKLLINGKLDNASEASNNDCNNSDTKLFMRDSIKKVYMKMVELVLKSGFATYKGEKTPIYDFIKNNNIGPVKLLSRREQVTNAKNTEGKTPLVIAIEANDIDIIKKIQILEFLIEHGAKVNAKSDDGLTPFFVAMQIGNLEIIKFLIQKGADINRRNLEGKTPLFIAIDKNNKELIKLLIEAGANIHASDSKGKTPLLMGIDQNDIRLVDLLIQYGADYKTELLMQEEIVIQDSEVETVYKHKTPLLYAIEHNKIQSVEFLIKHGVNIHEENRDGITPLLAAIYNNNKEIIKLLVEHEADINAKTDYGKSPLCTAIERFEKDNNKELVEFFIESGADVNVRDENGNTALLLLQRCGMISE